MENITKNGSSACPDCLSTPDPVTGLCLCPQTATDGASPLSPSSGPSVAQAESLFETYLEARLLRARRSLKRAKAALLREPRNRATLDQARYAEIEAERLRVQLAEQARRIAQGRDGTNGNLDPAARSDDPMALLSAHATEGFRAAQAARAEVSYLAVAPTPLGRRSLPEERRCPQCGNPVLGEATGCECGHRFDRSDRRAAAESVLSSEEFAALCRGLKALKRAE